MQEKAERSPAQLYALVIGLTLLAVGLVGFLVEPSFAVGDDLKRDELIAFDVNGWHNLVHIATGALGLAMMGSWAAAKAYALGLGLVYTVVAIWGFAEGNNGAILDIVPVNTADNLLHLGIALTGLAAYAATREVSERGRAGRPATKAHPQH